MQDDVDRSASWGRWQETAPAPNTLEVRCMCPAICHVYVCSFAGLMLVWAVYPLLTPPVALLVELLRCCRLSAPRLTGGCSSASYQHTITPPYCILSHTYSSGVAACLCLLPVVVCFDCVRRSWGQVLPAMLVEKSGGWESGDGHCGSPLCHAKHATSMFHTPPQPP